MGRQIGDDDDDDVHDDGVIEDMAVVANFHPRSSPRSSPPSSASLLCQNLMTRRGTEMSATTMLVTQTFCGGVEVVVATPPFLDPAYRDEMTSR